VYIEKNTEVRTTPVLVSYSNQLKHSPKRGFAFTVQPVYGVLSFFRCENKTGVVRTCFFLFLFLFFSFLFFSLFKIDLCSAASMGSSRRDLLNDMTEHRPIFKK